MHSWYVAVHIGLLPTLSQRAVPRMTACTRRDAQARALAESRRMSGEAAKSDEKRKKMYAEMGLTEQGMANMTNQHLNEIKDAQGGASGAAGEDDPPTVD